MEDSNQEKNNCHTPNMDKSKKHSELKILQTKIKLDFIYDIQQQPSLIDDREKPNHCCLCRKEGSTHCLKDQKEIFWADSNV